MSLAIWDHTMLLATRHKWTHPVIPFSLRVILKLTHDHKLRRSILMLIITESWVPALCRYKVPLTTFLYSDVDGRRATQLSVTSSHPQKYLPVICPQWSSCQYQPCSDITPNDRCFISSFIWTLNCSSRQTKIHTKFKFGETVCSTRHARHCTATGSIG